MFEVWTLVVAALFVVVTAGGAIYVRLWLRRWSRALWMDLGKILSHSKQVEGQVLSLREEMGGLRERFGQSTEDTAKLRGDIGKVLRLGGLPPQDSRPKQALPARLKEGEIISFLRSLDHPDEASRRYLEIHWERTVRTLTLAPTAGGGAALELGAYLQMAAGLKAVHGYENVRAAYYGPVGHFQLKSIAANGADIFHCRVDLFDAEKHLYPYPDGTFSLVLACEIIEHLLHDPMHLLTECGRVLRDGGLLILSTPNVASYSSVARVLEGSANPQVYSLYPRLESERPHVREFTPGELELAARAAGFEIEALFTEGIAGVATPEWAPRLLSEYGFPTNLRGEQIYLTARKKSGIAIDRYPEFLYEKRD